MCRPQGDHLALAALDDRAYVVGPERQRRLDLALVGRPVVDAGYAATVSAVVAENFLDDVRLDAEIAQAGGDCPPDVVRRPMRFQAELRVEQALAGGP